MLSMASPWLPPSICVVSFSALAFSYQFPTRITLCEPTIHHRQPTRDSMLQSRFRAFVRIHRRSPAVHGSCPPSTQLRYRALLSSSSDRIDPPHADSEPSTSTSQQETSTSSTAQTTPVQPEAADGDYFGAQVGAVVDDFQYALTLHGLHGCMASTERKIVGGDPCSQFSPHCFGLPGPLLGAR